MAFPSTCLAEIENGGSDLNGGWFNVGASGTDYSQQTAPQVTLDGATIKWTTSGATATMTLSGVTGVAAHVGNVVRIPTGITNATAGIYAITAYTSSTWVLDRNCCTGAVAGGSGRMGGCLATPGQWALDVDNYGQVGGGNHGFLKYNATAYQITTSSVGSGGPVLNVINGNNQGDICTLVGYNTTRTLTNSDALRPTIQATVGSITMAGTYYANYASLNLRNIILDANSQSSVIGWQGRYNYIRSTCINVMVKGGATTAFQDGFAINCESSANVEGFDSVICHGCYAHGSTGSGSTGGSGFFRCPAAIGCLSTGNQYGFTLTDTYSNGFQHCAFCTADGNTSHGFNVYNAVHGSLVANCLSTNNGGYGYYTYNSDISLWPASADYNNTSGATNQTVNAGTSWFRPSIPTLTAQPYNNRSSGDYSLNTTAGGGAALRAAGYPPSMNGGMTPDDPDIGEIQHGDPQYPKLNTASANDQLTELIGDYPAGSTLSYYTGSSPGANTAATGTLLVTITLPASPWGSVSGASVALNGTWSATAAASGTPGYARLSNAARTKNVDFTVAASGSPNITCASITVGNTVVLSSITLTS